MDKNTSLAAKSATVCFAAFYEFVRRCRQANRVRRGSGAPRRLPEKLVLPGAAGHRAVFPMSLARPERAWYFATICTLTSVAGGLLGYFIGAVLYDTGRRLAHSSLRLWRQGGGVPRRLCAIGSLISAQGLTPIPYKIVTITSGFAAFNLPLFVVLSLITRGARFFAEAFLLNRYGARARGIIEKQARPLGRPGGCRRGLWLYRRRWMVA